MYRLIDYCKLCGTKILHSQALCIQQTAFKNIHTTRSLLALDPAYVPHKLEEINLKDDYFQSPINRDKFQEPFTLVLPPPNITGTLHLGHALTVTIQDVLIKWKKMSGSETMWVPGIDHAGIATQVVVEKRLWQEQHLTRHDMGRENFEKEVWKWKQEKSEIINQQLRKLRVSLDWGNEIFTMDAQRSKAVQTAFITLFERGLIYRADQLVNWSCVLRSAVSDIEVEHLNFDGPTDLDVPNYDHPVRFGVLYKIAYKLVDSDQEIVVATTRPETMLGDVAIAVHPRDTRYSSLIGRKLWHPFRKEAIPLIADEYVDPNFGTGALKITPAHDLNDFQIAKKHTLNVLQVIDEKGEITNICDGTFVGVKRFDARKIVLDQLESLKLFKGVQQHAMVVPLCSRSKDVIELLVRPQWFIKCDQMAKKALDDVRNGNLVIEPRNFEKVWFDWLENIRDWCISRQLWWGHRIPAFMCHRTSDPDQKVWVAASDKHSALVKAGREFSRHNQTNERELEDIVVVQDDDVLDTWFSSALQPFSAFNWPEETEALKKYYPLTLMETGHDILFFWVARMVMLGTELTGKLPFSKILLHGIICDVHGRKMSKSLGNVIAPEDIINGCSLQDLENGLSASMNSGIISKNEFYIAMEGQKLMFPGGIPECGLDALRFTLLSHNIKSHFINFDISECYTNRLFCNKIWQATKYTIMSFGNVVEKQNLENLDQAVDFKELTLMNRWILSKLSAMVDSVNDGLNNYDFHIATTSLKNFIYYEFCDIYLETTKKGLRSLDDKAQMATGHIWTLLTCLDVSLRALAPFMPLLAQHLHEHLPLVGDAEAKCLGFPESLSWKNDHLEKEVDQVMELVTAIRRLKKTYNVTNKYNPEVYISQPNNKGNFIYKFTDIIKDLSVLHRLSMFAPGDPKNMLKNLENNLVKDTVSGCEIFLFVPEELKSALVLDLPKMQKKKSRILKELDKMHRMVAGSTYNVNASLEAQEVHSKKIASLQEQLVRIENIQQLTENKG